MKLHQRYEEKFNRKHDFLVRYKLIEDQDGYNSVLRQGMRSDFCYEEDFDTGPIHMIWPEFEDENGKVIIDSEASIQPEGTARMWVMLDESRPAHKERINMGKIGYLVSGSHKIAKVEVLEVVGL